MKRWILTAVILLFVGFVAWEIWHRIASKSQGGGRRGGRGPGAVAVETAPVRKVSLRDIRLFTGTLSPKSRYLVAPKTGGRLERLLVHIGDEVAQGQPIASIDDDEYQQQLEQARAELEVAKAEVEQTGTALETARREFERMKSLQEKQIVSASDFDVADSNYKTQAVREKVTRAQLDEKQAALNAAQVRLAYTQIRANWEDGAGTRFVGERFTDEGAMLTAGAAIVSIVDIRTLTAVIHVIESDYTKVQVGQGAVIATDAFPGREFAGTIIRIAPILKEESRQARVEIEVPNPEVLLKPGMFARVTIEFATHEDATVVAPGAIVKRDEKTGVFLLNREEKKAKFVPVRTGIETLDAVEVLEPALTGEVVTLGNHLLADGSDVILPGENGEKSAKGEKGAKGERDVSGVSPGEKGPEHGQDARATRAQDGHAAGRTQK